MRYLHPPCPGPPAAVSARSDPSNKSSYGKISPTQCLRKPLWGPLLDDPVSPLMHLRSGQHRKPTVLHRPVELTSGSLKFRLRGIKSPQSRSAPKGRRARLLFEQQSCPSTCLAPGRREEEAHA